ncbi:hypothetical protein NQZ79_g4604 [Umbelopsis isabellina]|nr:hypothetical protein NQZ79_g4604 [Umbelopsis isabellina]
MGNGQKAQMKRERNAKDAKKGPTSQLKVPKPFFLGRTMLPRLLSVKLADKLFYAPCVLRRKYLVPDEYGRI